MGLTLGASATAANGPHHVAPELLNAARQAGHVRVIVKVADGAQDSVLAQLTGTSARVLHRYLTSPFLALDVGEDALTILDRSASVVSVAADFPLQRQSPGEQR